MKVWNKPIRINSGNNSKAHDKLFNCSTKSYGITNWMVGRCDYPWSPWIQISIGYWSVQIKYYILVVLLMIISFLIGVKL